MRSQSRSALITAPFLVNVVRVMESPSVEVNWCQVDFFAFMIQNQINLFLFTKESDQEASRSTRLR